MRMGDSKFTSVGMSLRLVIDEREQRERVDDMT